MVSPEFKSTISNNNLLRARIMLKDSFVVDPSFDQLNEMLAYAERMLPDIMVPFDGDILESDSLKWNQEVMNMELVQLVNNFSEIRVNHLKEVISKVMAEEIWKFRSQRIAQPAKQSPSQYSNTHSLATKPLNATPTSLETKSILKRKALQQLLTEGRKINKVLLEVEGSKTWKANNIDELERAAKQILKAVQSYKDNR